MKDRHLSIAFATCVITCTTLFPMEIKAQTANHPNDPTANTLTPEQIDGQWIEANSKYDGERKRLLTDVEKSLAGGPFRDPTRR